MSGNNLPTTEEFYFENGYVVFTAAYHRKRGYCCESGCRHCPYSEAEKIALPKQDIVEPSP